MELVPEEKYRHEGGMKKNKLLYLPQSKFVARQLPSKMLCLLSREAVARKHHHHRHLHTILDLKTSERRSYCCAMCNSAVVRRERWADFSSGFLFAVVCAQLENEHELPGMRKPLKPLPIKAYTHHSVSETWSIPAEELWAWRKDCFFTLIYCCVLLYQLHTLFLCAALESHKAKMFGKSAEDSPYKNDLIINHKTL